jgi:hypothetical protein
MYPIRVPQGTVVAGRWHAAEVYVAEAVGGGRASLVRVARWCTELGLLSTMSLTMGIFLSPGDGHQLSYDVWSARGGDDC